MIQINKIAKFVQLNQTSNMSKINIQSISIIPILLLSTMILSFLSISNLKAVAMLVEDPTANATAALTASRMLDSVKKATEMINQYSQMLEKAQKTIDDINKVNDSISQVGNLIETSTMGLPNPIDIKTQLEEMPKRFQKNVERIANAVVNYNIRDHWQWKKLQGICPHLEIDSIAPDARTLSYNEIGKESEAMKAFKALGDALNSNIVTNALSVAGEFKGRAMALEACLLFAKEQQKLIEHQFQEKLKEAILKRDEQAYQNIKRDWINYEIQYRKDTRFLKSQQTDPLINRSRQMLETLGVMDKTYNDEKNNIFYCKPGKDQTGKEFCYPMFYDTTRLNDKFNKIQKELLEKITNARNDKKAQAQVYADMKQKTDEMLLQYTKDIANNLSFMNETISLIGNLVTRDYRAKYGDDDELSESVKKEVDEITRNFESQTLEYKGFKDYKANLDKYGFPIITFSSKKEDND